jgi:hypothetical protein
MNRVKSQNGDAQISKGACKFGISSGLFNVSGVGGYITTPDHADFDFGSGNFTIDFWCRATAVGQTNGSTIVGKGSSYHPWLLLQRAGGGGYILGFYSSSNNSSWNLASDLTVGTITKNVWNHVAIVRDGATMRTFVDGVPGSTANISTTALMTSSAVVRIGNVNIATTNFTGSIDEFRFSKGIARWTSDFSASLPPSPYTGQPACYLNSRGRSRGSVGGLNPGISSQNSRSVQ